MRAFLVFMIFIGKGLLLLLGVLLVVGGGTCIAGGGFNAAGALGLAMLIPGLGMLALVFRKAGSSDQATEASLPPEKEK